MFCKWCGKKIVNNGTTCPSCGRNQGALENGNYFQDLCDMQIPVVKKVTEIKVTEPKVLEHELPAVKKKSKKAVRLLRLIAIVIFTVLALLTGLFIGLFVDKKEQGVPKEIEEVQINNEVKPDRSIDLKLERYDSTSGEEKYVYVATYDVPEEVEVTFYWQNSKDYGVKTWNTLGEGTSFVVHAEEKEGLYRVLCVVNNEEGGEYYYEILK